LRILAVLSAAVAIFFLLVNLKPKAERQAPVATGLLVEAIPVKAESVDMVVEAYGTVQPREILRLVAEVPGRIVKINPVFREGNLIKRGKNILTIDPRAYQLEVERRKVQINQVQADLRRLEQEVRNIKTRIEIAQSDLVLAKADFLRLKILSGKNVIAQTTLDKAEQKNLSSRERLQMLENQLALTGPTREQLEAQRNLTKVMLRQAELDLEKTGIHIPFDGWVKNKGVEVGQHVSPGEHLGTVYRDGAYDVEVRIPVRDLKWLPDLLMKSTISDVDVFFAGQDTSSRWQGRVARVKAQMDEKTRTLPVVVEIDGNSAAGDTPINFNLRPGMFVTVKIQGKRVEKAFVLPRYMVHAEDVVYLASGRQLQVRPVTVLRRFKDTAFIAGGLSDGDLVIKTPMSGATDGMRIRLK